MTVQKIDGYKLLNFASDIADNTLEQAKQTASMPFIVTASPQRERNVKTMTRVTVTEYRDSLGYPTIEIKRGKISAGFDKDGVSLSDYDNEYLIDAESIDDAIAVLKKAKQLLATDPPTHLSSNRHIPQPKPTAICHCGHGLNWYTDDGGYWGHAALDGNHIDGWHWTQVNVPGDGHTPTPKNAPVHGEPQTRIVHGSINDLIMTEDGKWIVNE